MRIIIGDGKKLLEKHINYNNPKINFEYNEYLDFFTFEYIDDKVLFKKNELYHEILNEVNELYFEEYSKLIIKSKIDNTYYDIYIMPDYDYSYKEKILNTDKIVIGNNNMNISNIILKKDNSSFDNITLKINDNDILFENTGEFKVYINNIINEENSLTIKYGDMIFIDGVFFVIVAKKIFIYYGKDIILDKNDFKEEENKEEDLSYYKSIQYINNAQEYKLNISPTIKKKIIKKTISIDPPSPIELKEGTPLFLTMLPMVLMSSTSIIMSLNIIGNIRDGKTTWKDNSISLIFSAVMIFTMILYPIIQNFYKKRRQSKREIRRIEEYKDYIYEQKRKILNELEEQKNILINNYKDTKNYIDLINDSIEQIWDKKTGDEDFLTVSLGTGQIVPDITVNYPEEHFTIDRDKLRVQIDKLKEECSIINDCPISVNLYKNNNIAFEGKKEILYDYMKSFLVRLMGSHSYNDIKFCVISNEKNKKFWQQYSNLPYFWNENYDLRFFGYDTSSITNIVNYLDNIYKDRKSNYENNQVDKNNINYIIIIDNYKKTNEITFLNEVASSENNYNFTIMFMTEYISLLPSYCKNFIKIKNNEGTLIVKDNNYNEIKFVPDFYNIDFTNIYEKISAIYSSDDFQKKLPEKINFLEMFKVDGIESLNVIDKWNNNTTLDNMSVPIGVNEYGELIKLDLHENAHGPHGLIAGMTGSGKSELIISLILSYAINYSPNDVQFVLIDYKGGGLSNTFYNNETAKRLPHIVGVITNISENEINRCLISLQSEIKRRQVLFSEASIRFNEGNIDIYKYQQLCKNNPDMEYLSHLIIISDEFAELKTQNPEFIDKLVSLARIGRSLGIHLILCTQKPNGVVDSQIWSNSKFKICLKVQEKSDSREIIGVEDAVYLNLPGRFYLQIGYNELFMKGQCAYANAPYYIEEKDSIMSNFKLEFINEFGKVYYTKNALVPDTNIISGTHVSNLVRHLINIALEQGYKSKYLWKDSLEEEIVLDDLLKKHVMQSSFVPEIVFGEYDDIDNQKKDLARYSLLDGNIILYGLTGSGKSELVQTSLYYLIKTYSPEELNIYILDFYLENMKVFLNAPQVGDVVYLYEKEKIVNTFKYINTIINQRKELLSNYNGNIENYNRTNETKLPVICLIINNLERLFENFPEIEAVFLDITRDCNKFGINIFVTVNTISSVRSKLLQGFKQIISLELKDKYDYDSIFGMKVNYSLPHILGRGFIKKDKVYEMQTAKILKEKDNLYPFIEKFCDELTQLYNIKVDSIPILPSKVSYDLIKNCMNNNLLIPTGIDVESLEIIYHNFSKKGGTIISGRDYDMLEIYTKAFIKNISTFNTNKVFMFTVKNDIKLENAVVINSNYGNYFNQLSNFIDKINNKIDYFIVFESLGTILEKLDLNLEEKNLFYQLIDKINNVENFHMILVDTITAIKRYEYNEFYTASFNNNFGIYIGNGITEQFVIKTSNVPRKYREVPEENFGYYIENNKVKCMKILEYDDEKI